MTDLSFQYASPCLWNQLPASFCQPHPSLSISDLSLPMPVTLEWLDIFICWFMTLIIHDWCTAISQGPMVADSCTDIHCLKKVPTFKLSITMSNLNQFSKFLHCWKAYQFATKTIWHYPTHLGHVATLPWEIKNSNFLQIFSRYGRKSKQIVFVHWFYFLYTCNCICWVYLCVNRLFEILSIRRHSYFLFTALSADAWPPVSCACVPQVFQQLTNIMLCPAFLRKFICQPLCRVPLQIRYKLALVTEYHVDCWQTLQWCLLWQILGATNWSQK